VRALVWTIVAGGLAEDDGGTQFAYGTVAGGTHGYDIFLVVLAGVAAELKVLPATVRAGHGRVSMTRWCSRAI